MTIQDSGQVNSDQDLASVLAGVSGGSDDNLRFEETGAQDADTTSRPLNQIGRASCRERV